MNTPSDKSEARDEIDAIAERAERGEDIPAYFTNRHWASATLQDFRCSCRAVSHA